MGADGGIRIYNIDSLSEDELTLIKKHLLDGQTYIQSLDGKQYPTVYQGDNIFVEPTFVAFKLYYNYGADCFDKWYDGDWIMYYTDRSTRQKLYNLVQKLYSGDSVYWECWT